MEAIFPKNQLCLYIDSGLVSNDWVALEQIGQAVDESMRDDRRKANPVGGGLRMPSARPTCHPPQSIF